MMASLRRRKMSFLPYRPARSPQFSYWIQSAKFYRLVIRCQRKDFQRRGSGFSRRIVARPECFPFAILALDGLVDFLAMDGNVVGAFDAEANLVAANVHNGDDNVIANDEAFV